MLKVERFINELMSSNCYIVVDEASKHCICIDPGSEKSSREIDYLEKNNLTLDYIILTHEHTDHTWGVNALTKRFCDVKVICSEYCKSVLPFEAQAYFSFYFDDPNYQYKVGRIDYTTEELNDILEWEGGQIHFIYTPGHSKGSICLETNGLLFGGDTLMPFKPYIKKKAGGSIDEYKDTLQHILEIYSLSTLVYPGHGNCMTLKDLLPFYSVILGS